MSRSLSSWEYGGDEFYLGDMVYFNYGGSRLYGEVVRVYATHMNYHVEEADGSRYAVNIIEDKMAKEE